MNAPATVNAETSVVTQFPSAGTMTTKPAPVTFECWGVKPPVICIGPAPAVKRMLYGHPAFAGEKGTTLERITAVLDFKLNSGVELAKEKNFDQAITSMKKAVELAPRNDLYLAMLSDYELKASKFADGLEHAAAAIKLNDKVGAYYVLAAANAYADQEIDRAREYCETVLKREKEFGSAAASDIRKLIDQMLKKTWTIHPPKHPNDQFAGAGIWSASASPSASGSRRAWDCCSVSIPPPPSYSPPP